MSVTWVPFVLKREYAVYDGTNGAALIAAFPGCVLDSDTGSQLDFHNATSEPFTLLVGEALSRTAEGALDGAWTGPNVAALSALPNLVAGFAPEVTLVQSVGVESVPASLLGNPGADYDVDLDAPMPSLAYAAVCELRGAPNIVSGHSILSHSILSVDQVRVRVQSGAASLAGATIHVTAIGVAADA